MLSRNWPTFYLFLSHQIIHAFYLLLKLGTTHKFWISCRTCVPFFATILDLSNKIMLIMFTQI
jgi:hypothetical protein